MSASYRGARGVSLIELMVALLIGTLLVLGLVEVFAASRTAYQMSEGVSRVQENSRFAMDFLQRDLRMGGHLGCVNDQSHAQNPGELNNHLNAVANPQLDFGASVQGYDANGTAPGSTINLQGLAGNWTPELPAYIKGLNPEPAPGSDVVVLRYLSSEGVPVTGVAMAAGDTTITVPTSRWPSLTSNGLANPALFGIADCKHVDIFYGTTNAGAGTINTKLGGLNTADFTADHYGASPPGMAMLYRAEIAVYYVAPGASGENSLWRARFNAPGGALTAFPEELVEGIESMQLLYGLDSRVNSGVAGPPTGYVDSQVTAANVATNWGMVGLLRVGLLTKSPGRAAAQGPGTDVNRLPTALGVRFTMPDPYDGNYRATYESTIALRNRLYGN